MKGSFDVGSRRMCRHVKYWKRCNAIKNSLFLLFEPPLRTCRRSASAMPARPAAGTAAQFVRSYWCVDGYIFSIPCMSIKAMMVEKVHADFEFYGGAVGLSTFCLYGGSPYRGQELALKRGVDIVVGTPGRIKDHIERGTLDLKSLKFRILDEADEMLNMGFVPDVDLILDCSWSSSFLQLSGRANSEQGLLN